MRIIFKTILLLLFATSAFAQLTVPYGGTGDFTLNPYAILIGPTDYTGAILQLPLGASGQILRSGGAGAAPTWATGTSGLITDTLPVAKGGTGLKTVTGYLKGSGTANLSVVTTIPIADGGTNAATFSGAQTNLGWASPATLAADTATTGQSLIGTPLQFTIGANDVWDFDIFIHPTNSGTNGTKIGILLPTSATMSAQVWGSTSAITAGTSDIMTASNTAGALFNTSTAATDIIWVHGWVAGGGTGGAVVLQFLSAVAGTATIKASSYISAHRRS